VQLRCAVKGRLDPVGGRYPARQTLGWEEKLQARIVNYADDFVILCRGSAKQAKEVMEKLMEKLKLTVNQQKIRICRVPEESFDFLGYTLGFGLSDFRLEPSQILQLLNS
jgi:hypothetical protein